MRSRRSRGGRVCERERGRAYGLGEERGGEAAHLGRLEGDRGRRLAVQLTCALRQFSIAGCTVAPPASLSQGLRPPGAPEYTAGLTYPFALRAGARLLRALKSLSA